MPSRKVHHVSLAVLAVLLLGGGAAVALAVIGRGPLTGVTSHDFGRIWIDDRSSVREHTFSLVNNGSATIHVLVANPSCGCTAVRMSGKAIPPGGTWDLETTFKLSGTGVKKAQINLAMDIDGETHEQTLHVEGVGRRRKTVWASETEFGLRAGIAVSYRFIAEELESDDMPAVPALAVPAPLEASFDRWQRQRRRSRSQKTPNVWQGVVRVLLPAGTPVPEDATLTIAVPGHPDLVVDLVMHDPGRRYDARPLTTDPAGGPTLPPVRPPAPESLPDTPPGDR